MEASSPETIVVAGIGTTSPTTDDNVPAAALTHGISDLGRTKHGRKRDRVALACQRCKSKKQKVIDLFSDLLFRGD